MFEIAIVKYPMATPTEEQLAVIRAPIDRHIKVVAVAGAGKSTTLVQRVEHLIKEGVKANRIYILMFNKAAQVEFSERLETLLGAKAGPTVRTYHSLGFNICKALQKANIMPCRELSASEGYQRKIAKAAVLSVIGNPTGKPCNPNRPSVLEDFLSFIAFWKSGTDSPKDVFKKMAINTDFKPFIKALKVYEQARAEEKVRFMSDLLYDPIVMLRKSEKARALIANHIDQIIIDEYQDINEVSQELIRFIAGTRAHVTVVGDDDQTIYAFRGSNPSYLISGFDEDFKDPLLFRMTRTFRYGHALSMAANNVIGNNKDRVDKMCISGPGTPDTVIGVSTDDLALPCNPEQRGIVRAIRNWQAKGRPLSENAILLRVFSTSAPLELILLQCNIPYMLHGSKTVFELKDIKAMIGVLMIADGSLWEEDDEERYDYLRCILSVPHVGIGAAEMDQLIRSGGEDAASFLAQIEETASYSSDYVKEKLFRHFRALERTVRRELDRGHAVVDDYIVNTRCYEMIKDMAGRASEARKQVDVLESLLMFCQQQALNTAETLSLIRQLMAERAKQANGLDAVLITSTHRSKGLEWPQVIIPSATESIFPYMREDKPDDVEGERRLFYVAMTRAREQVQIIIPRDPTLIELLGRRSCTAPVTIRGDRSHASRFVYEANLKGCMDLRNAINDTDTFGDLPRFKDISTFNDYLRAINIDFRLPKAS